MSRFSRRSFFKWSGITAAAILTPLSGYAGYQWSRMDITNSGKVQFAQPLAIPPVIDLEPDRDGRATPELDIRPGVSSFVPGSSTPTWGINGTYLGPTLRGKRGTTVAPRITNNLPEITTLHWHGMELPARADGGPHQMIDPGGTWMPEWMIDQPAATLWYHPHPHGTTRQHVYRGLAGLFLVEDDQPTGLPDTYGVDDIPLIVQDKRFSGDGSLDESELDFSIINSLGLLGDTILVNGTWGPVLDIRDELVRFRILNGSNARIYDFAFTDQREFQVIAADSGYLPAPVTVNHVQLSPGERSEIVVKFTPGESVLLRSQPPDLGTMPLYGRVIGGDDQFDVLLIRAASSLRPSRVIPASLPAPPPIPQTGTLPERSFSLGTRSINGDKVDMDRIDFVVPLGTPETWKIKNAQGIPHNFHVHNAMFQVLDIDGHPPPPALAGFKDTVYVPPLQTVRFAVQFGQFADPFTPYMVHCHLLAHEDSGMMLQFVMVEPGTEDQVNRQLPPSSPASGQHHHP